MMKARFRRVLAGLLSSVFVAAVAYRSLTPSLPLQASRSRGLVSAASHPLPASRREEQPGRRLHRRHRHSWNRVTPPASFAAADALPAPAPETREESSDSGPAGSLEHPPA